MEEAQELNKGPAPEFRMPGAEQTDLAKVGTEQKTQLSAQDPMLCFCKL